MKALLVALLLVLTLSSAPTATTCSNTIPLGTVATPECTWIVEQIDPGVWMDNLRQYWVLGLCVNGVCSGLPVKVKLEDLHIGRWKVLSAQK